MAARKVLFLVNTLHVGGFERDVASLCEHVDLTRFHPEVWILHGGGPFEDHVRRSGITLRNFRRGWARNPLFAVNLAREISRSNADIIHAFLPTIATYAALSRRYFGVKSPMVLSIGQSQADRRDRLMFRLCSRSFDWLIANSRSAEQLGKSLGFAPDRISVIPNGHQIEQFTRRFDRHHVRTSVGVEADETMVLYVGRLTDTKRVCDAVAAMASLRDVALLKLVLAGEGPERGALEAQVATLGLAEMVRFAGHRSDVVDLLRTADLFVFPSETEGLPNSVIEASLAGLPIVACDVPGVVDVVEDGESAILVRPRDPSALAAAIRRLLGNPLERNRLAQSAQLRAKNTYSIDRSLASLYDVYRRLLDPRVGCLN